jgi:tetratricopeptide (TPR) repeat protein
MKTIKSFTIIAILLLSQNIFAQDFEKQIPAFSKSYEYETSSDYASAINTLKTIYDANSYEINLRLAWLSYMSGLFTESVAYYQKSIALMPMSIEAKFGIINPLAALGNWTQVQTHYDKILEIDEKNTTANYRLGMIYYGKKDFTKAISYFQKNVNLYPFTYDSLIMFAWSNFQLGKTREAKILFNKCLLYNPTDASALEGLSLIK